MAAVATIPARKLADLIHGAHRGESKAVEQLRAWAEQHPDEARHAARRSWKMAVFLNEQRLVEVRSG